MITREQVEDLQPGDVVELHRQGWSEDVVVRGTVQGDTCVNEFWIGDYSLRSETDQVPEWFDFPGTTLTVVSRAPRPLYVNHPRTEPAPGDIVDYRSRSTGSTIGPFLYTYVERWAGAPGAGGLTRWVGLPGCHPDTGPLYNAGALRLLVDGETGQVVP